MISIVKVRSIAAQYYHFQINKMELIKSKHRAFLFGTPCHSNMGDQAQTYCTKLWIERNYPGYDVIPLQTNEVFDCNLKLLEYIRKHILPNDLVFLHSGYHTTDIYPMEEKMQRKIIEMFPDYRIVILPQTIMFKDKQYMTDAAKVYNLHPNLTLMCRDNVSYELAQKIFYNCKLICFPDIVTTLIGTKVYEEPRDGILFCMRNDCEAAYKPEQIAILRKKLATYGKIAMTDTTIPLHPGYIKKNRKTILENIFSEYARYRLVITDRYHGTIFSMIAATPVIVLNTLDHKLSSGVKWFPEEFQEYIQFIDTLDDVERAVKGIFRRHYDYKHSEYFNEFYYNHLKEMIE